MKINKLQWAKCPHCKVLINGWDYYSAETIVNGSPEYSVCPKCFGGVTFKIQVNVKLSATKRKKNV